MDEEEDIVSGAANAGLKPSKHPEPSGSLLAEVGGLERQLDALAARVAASESHISTSLISAIQDFDLRAASAEQARFAQGEDLNSLMKYLEKAFAGIDTISIRLDDLADSASDGSQQRLEFIEQKILEASTRIDVVEHATARTNEETGKKLAGIKGISEQLDGNDVRLSGIATIAEDTLRAMENLQDRISNNGAGIAALNEQHAALSERQVKDHQRADGMATVAEDTLRAMESLQERITKNGTTIGEISDVLVDVESRVDSDGHRIHEIAELTDEVVPTLAQLGSRVVDAQRHIDDAYTAIERLDQNNSDASLRTAADSDRIEQIHTRVDDAGQRIDQFHQRVDESGERLDQLHQRVDEAGGRIGDTHELIGATRDKIADRFVELEASVVALKIDDYDNRSTDGPDTEALVGESVRLLETQDAAIVELRVALSDALGRLDEVEVELAQKAPSNGQKQPANVTEPNSDRVDQLESILVDAVTKVNELTQAQNNAANGRDPEMASAVGKISNDLDGASVELRSHRSEIEMLNARLTQLEASAGHAIGPQDAVNGGLEQLNDSDRAQNGGVGTQPEAEAKGPGREKGLFRRR